MLKTLKKSGIVQKEFMVNSERQFGNIRIQIVKIAAIGESASVDVLCFGLILILMKSSAERRCTTMGATQFFFNDTATTEIYTLSLHDALPILMWRATAALYALSLRDALPILM